MPITITYTNQDIDEYDLFEEITQITNFNLVFKIDFSKNELTTLPNMNFPNLQTFNCHYNHLTSLPNMNLPNLQYFYCSDNQLTLLPDNMNFPNLQHFDCNNNKITSLHALNTNINFPLLEILYCNNNKLTSLPACILNFKNLHHNNNEIDLSLQIIKGECKREKKEERLNC